MNSLGMTSSSLNNEKCGEKGNFLPKSWILVLFHSGFHYETQGKSEEALCRLALLVLSCRVYLTGRKNHAVLLDFLEYIILLPLVSIFPFSFMVLFYPTMIIHTHSICTCVCT